MLISTVKSSPTPRPPSLGNKQEGRKRRHRVLSYPSLSLACEGKIILCVLLCPIFYPSLLPQDHFLPFSTLDMCCSGCLGSWVRQKAFSFLGWFLSFKLLQLQLKKEINIVTVRKMHKITPTAENLPPPAAAEGLLGSCSLRYINSHHTWLTHTAMGQHIVGWQDKVKFNYCYFHNEWSISSIGFKKLDETAVTGRVVRSWNMRLPFSCEEQSVSSKMIFFFLSDKLWHC